MTVKKENAGDVCIDGGIKKKKRKKKKKNRFENRLMTPSQTNT